jgi:REP element-mobilizing transposase RayT
VESLRNRKLIRLRNWNYSTPWWYYVTITTKNHKKYFGIQRESTIILNDFGKRADTFWQEIPYHYSFIELDKYIIMPNHIHGIILMNYQIIGA